MPTTTRSSELALCLVAALSLLAAGCASLEPSSGTFAPREEAPRERAAQTRFFETRDATELLSASAAVLQDLGFHIEESARDMGFLRAAKERSALEYRQELGRVLALLLSLGDTLMPIDLHQQIACSLVTRPLDPAGTRQEVRITFYRVVWQGDGMYGSHYLPPGTRRMEMIRDPAIYAQFFAKLSKSVFLEAYTL